jgi:hypothetical protein
MSTFKQRFQRSLRKAIRPLLEEYFPEKKQFNDSSTQVLLRMHYQQRLHQKLPMPKFDDVEFRAHSQTGEDGILLFVFSVLGATNKRVLEVCAGNGYECNAANLIINHGWQGLLFDGNQGNIDAANEYYLACKDTPLLRPNCVHAWLTTDNMDALIQEHGFAGEVDLLSLDIDGNDYWLWQSMECVSPRVVILEYENAWGPHRAVTQAYKPDSVWKPHPLSLPTAGASLSAFVKLGRRKGYRLVGCNRMCYNAVFVRNDVGADILPEISTEACFSYPVAQKRMSTVEENQDIIDTVQYWVDV